MFRAGTYAFFYRLNTCFRLLRFTYCQTDFPSRRSRNRFRVFWGAMCLSLLGLMSAACCVCTYISFELTLLVSSGRTSAYQRRLLAQVHRIASSARGESAWAHARRLSCSTSSCSEHDPLFKRSPAPPRHRAHKWHMVSTSRLALMYFFPFIFALLLLLFLLLLSNVLFIHSSCHSSSSLCTSITRYGSVFAAAILRDWEQLQVTF